MLVVEVEDVRRKHKIEENVFGWNAARSPIAVASGGLES